MVNLKILILGLIIKSLSKELLKQEEKDDLSQTRAALDDHEYIFEQKPCRARRVIDLLCWKLNSSNHCDWEKLFFKNEGKVKHKLREFIPTGHALKETLTETLHLEMKECKWQHCFVL